MIEYSRYDSPISPFGFVSILHKRRKLVMFLFLIVFVTIVGASFVLPPVYRSDAKLMIKYQDDSEKEYLLDLNQAGGAGYDRIASELVIVKMRSVLEPVVSELGLDSEPAKDSKVDGFFKAIGLRKEAVAADAAGTMLHNQAIIKLAHDLQVEREKDTNVLVLGYESDDPVKAAGVIDKVINEYQKQRPKLDRDERAYEFFDNQIQEIEGRIAKLEQQGMMYKSREKVLSPDNQTQILISSAGDFDKELTKIRSQRMATEARLKVVRDQLARGEEIAFPNMESSEKVGRMDYLNELKKTLLELELEKNAMSKKYTEKHPEMVRVQQDIEATRLKIRNEVDEFIRAEETSVRAMYAAEQAITGRMNQVVNSISDLSRQEYELGKLSIGIEDLRQVCSMLIRQREEARIAASKQEYLVQIRVIEPAMVAPHPVKPNKPLFAGLALILGIVVSLGGVFVLEMFDHSVNTVEDARHCLGLPILAAIPEFRAEQAQKWVPRLNAPGYSVQDMATVD